MDIRRRRKILPSDADSDYSNQSSDDSQRRRVRKRISAKRNQRHLQMSHSNGNVGMAQSSSRRANVQQLSNLNDEISSRSSASNASSRRSQRRGLRRTSVKRSGKNSTGRRRRAYVARLLRGVSNRRNRGGCNTSDCCRGTTYDTDVQQNYDNASLSSRRLPKNIHRRQAVTTDGTNMINSSTYPHNSSSCCTPTRSRRGNINYSSPKAHLKLNRYNRSPNHEAKPYSTSNRRVFHRINNAESHPIDNSSDDSSNSYQNSGARQSKRIRTRQQTPMPTSASRQARHRYQRIRNRLSSDEEDLPQELFPSSRTTNNYRNRKTGFLPAPEILGESSFEEDELYENNILDAGTSSNRSFQ